MKWSGLMLSNTLITMRWQIALSLCGVGQNLIQQGKSGCSCQCDQSPVVSQESSYLKFVLLRTYVQKHNWYESITLNCHWASHSSARWIAEHHTGKHTTINCQHQTGTSLHRWGIQVDMLIINKDSNRFLESSLFVCEMCIAFGAFVLWAGPC